MSFPISTTDKIPGREPEEGLGVVNARVVAGVNIIAEWLAGFADTFGTRSMMYQAEMDNIQRTLLQELEVAARKRGADAVVGVRIDYDQLTGGGKSMLMASAIGTAVRLSPENTRPAFSELGMDAAPPDVRRVLDAVRDLLGWAESFVAGKPPSSGKQPTELTSPAAWALTVEREGMELVDRFIIYLRQTPTPRSNRLLAHLLTLKPQADRVDGAAALLEDKENLPEFEGIAEVVSYHWPLVVPRLTRWLVRGGPYRALAMKVVAYGKGTSMRLADLRAFEELIDVVRGTEWGSGAAGVPRWTCGCANVVNPSSGERCTRCGLQTRGLQPKDVPFHPAELLAMLLQQHRLLRFLQPVAHADAGVAPPVGA